MSPCVVFRVDGDSSIGLGHLMRCLALAQGLVAQKIRVIFAVQPSSVVHCESRIDWAGEIHCVPVSVTEPTFLRTLCTDVDAQWLILDGYQFDASYRELLGVNRFNVGMFDDGQLGQDKAVDAELALVINWASSAETLPYQTYAPNAHICAGELYRVLRPEFLLSVMKPYHQRNDLLIMFGGSDPSHLTLPLLQRFEASEIRLPITIVTGGGYQHLSALKECISKTKLAITHHHDCQHVAELFRQARMAISAAGSSQFELLACATPSLLVVTADNQKFASEGASKQGWCHVVEYETVNAEYVLDELVQRAIGLWHQPDVLMAMHHQAKTYRYKSGTARIIDRLYPKRADQVGIDEFE